MIIKTSGTARSVTLLHAQPDDLRLIASQIEAAIQNAESTRQHVTKEISDTITIVSKVERPLINELIEPKSVEDSYLQTR